MTQNKTQRLLIFSIALNGYQWLYRDCLTSQQKYADKINADYVKIDRPYFTQVGTECCWLKLLLLQEALEKNFDLVLFLDADAEVQADAPDIREVVQNNKHIYMAMGKTNRFNSGVILLQNSPQARHFIDQVLLSRHNPIAAQHDVGWGENGHIIQTAEKQHQHSQWIAQLPTVWNNTCDPELHDYIRHYNHGIMRNQIKGYKLFNFIHKCLAKSTRAINQWKMWQEKQRYSASEIDAEKQLFKLFTAARSFHSQIF